MAFKDAIVAHLAARGVIDQSIAPETGLGDAEVYPPGNKLAEFLAQDELPDLLFQLKTNGMAASAEAESDLTHFDRIAWIRCPVCKMDHDQPKRAIMTAYERMLITGESPEIACPQCGAQVAGTEWEANVPLADSALKFRFWNWPLSRDRSSCFWLSTVVGIIRQATGLDVRISDGRL